MGKKKPIADDQPSHGGKSAPDGVGDRRSRELTLVHVGYPRLSDGMEFRNFTTSERETPGSAAR